MTKELTCVVCPAGCKMTAELDENGKVLSVTGNTCKRGETYAVSELTNPVRTLTSTVSITGAASETVMLPVKTSRPIPRGALFEAMDIVRKTSAKAPVTSGDILIENFIEEGTNLVACKTVH